MFGMLVFSAALARAEQPIKLESVSTADGGKDVVATNTSYAPITLRLDVTGQNIHSSNGLVSSQVIPARGRMRLTHITPATRGRYAFSYRSRYWKGDFRSRHDDNALYRIPFADGFKTRVIQAFGGKITTHTDIASEHAIDFSAREGTLITAARSGIVVEVVEHHMTGGPDARYRDKANRILVLHEDGTIAQYAHLQPRSALVQPGQLVRVGDLIGKVGNTGYSYGPHLHFAVQRIEKTDTVSVQVKSIPVTFFSESPKSIFTARQGMIVPSAYR